MPDDNDDARASIQFAPRDIQKGGTISTHIPSMLYPYPSFLTDDGFSSLMTTSAPTPTPTPTPSSSSSFGIRFCRICGCAFHTDTTTNNTNNTSAMDIPTDATDKDNDNGSSSSSEGRRTVRLGYNGLAVGRYDGCHSLDLLWKVLPTSSSSSSFHQAHSCCSSIRCRKEAERRAMEYRRLFRPPLTTTTEAAAEATEASSMTETAAITASPLETFFRAAFRSIYGNGGNDDDEGRKRSRVMDNLALFAAVLAYHQGQQQPEQQQHEDNDDDDGGRVKGSVTERDQLSDRSSSSLRMDEKKKKKQEEKKREDYSNDDDDDDNLYECVALLHTHHSSSSSSSSSSSFTNAATAVRSTTQTVSSIRRAVRRGRLHHISVLNPFGWYIRKTLLALNEEDLIKVMMVLGDRFPGIGIGCNGNDEYHDSHSDDETDGSRDDTKFRTKIRRWRMATRLVQMATDGGLHGLLEDTPLLTLPNDDDGHSHNGNNRDGGSRWRAFVSSLRREYYALCPSKSVLNLPYHSCLPNCLVEGTTTTTAARNDDDGGGDGDDDGTGPIHLSLIAIHDIRKGDVLRSSKIDDLSGDVNERGVLLEEVYGMGHVCGCVRCRIERNWGRRGEFVIRDAAADDGGGSAAADNDDGDEGRGLEDLVFDRRDVRHLADLAMQHGRYEDASELYGLFLLPQQQQQQHHHHNHHRQQDSGDMGDIIHARCASYLERGLLNDARRMWREAYELYPNHEGIALYVQKMMTYGDGDDDGDDDRDQNDVSPKTIAISPPAPPNLPPPPPHNTEFDTYLDGKCFVSRPHRPVLTQEECRRVIQWAEQYASSPATTTTSTTATNNTPSSSLPPPPSGWTTSRHYAVPTTDIPLHTIPHLSTWFRTVFHERIRPILLYQFNDDHHHHYHNNNNNGDGTTRSRNSRSSSNNNTIVINDAFVVRYDADSGQRHLPLHRDQSNVSFSIALNGWGDYDGGGTYFPALATTTRRGSGGGGGGGSSGAGSRKWVDGDGVVRPDTGGMVSFRGDELLHGGDPLVRGRRYIIVAFCHLFDGDNRDERQRRRRRRRKEQLGNGDEGVGSDVDNCNGKKKKMKLESMFRKEKEERPKEMEKFSFGFQIPA